MDGRLRKLINGSLILFCSLIVFIQANGLLESRAAGNEGKIAALFLLLNPLIVLFGFSLGNFLNFLYLSFAVISLRGLISHYQATYLSPLIWIYILTALISALLSRGLYFRISSYRKKSRSMDDKLDRLGMVLEENVKIKEALEKKLGRLSVLKIVTEELSKTLTLEEVTQLAVNKIMEIIPSSDTALVYLANEKQKLQLSSLRTKNSRLSSDETGLDIFDIWTVRHLAPLIVMDVRRDFRFGPGAAEEMKRDVRSLLAAPLMSENKILGILRLESYSPENFSPDDLRILDIFSDLVAIAVENSLLYSRMEELARRDGLTELFLPRYFHSQLEELIREQSPKVKFFSLLMLDIDYFKEYNDRYGHIAGDLLLKQIAVSLTSHLEKDDFAVRYGGEEFVLVLIGTELRDAVRRAESIRKEIAERVFFLRRQGTHITVSIGIAAYPADGRTKEELLHKADEWLYYAKEKGRNRIAYAGIK